MTMAEYWYAIAAGMTPKGVRFANWPKARYMLNQAAEVCLHHDQIGYEWTFEDRSRIRANESAESTMNIWSKV